VKVGIHLPQYGHVAGADAITRAAQHAESLGFAAKGGLVSLTQAMAKELAGKGVRVNCVAPGLIGQTSFHDRYTARDALIIPSTCGFICEPHEWLR